MKRVAGFSLNKKFLRNLVIGLVIVAVAYVVMRGVKEGFQEGNSKEYPFNIVYTAANGSSTSGTFPLRDRTLIIPKEDYDGKTIKNIRMMVYGASTQAYKMASAAKKAALEKWDEPNLSTAPKQPIDRAGYSIKFTSEVVTTDRKGKPTSTTYTLRGPNYFNNPSIKSLAPTDIFLGDLNTVSKLNAATKASLKKQNDNNMALFKQFSRGIQVTGLEQGPMNVDIGATGKMLANEKDNVKVILDF